MVLQYIDHTMAVLNVRKEPDSRMIDDQRYFRYQSGKGIQVSFAVNFGPSIQMKLHSSKN